MKSLKTDKITKRRNKTTNKVGCEGENIFYLKIKAKQFFAELNFADG